MRTLSLLLTSLLTLAACSSDDPPPQQTQPEFCQDWAAAACSSQVISACQAADVSQCQAAQLSFCADLIPSEGFGAESGGACLAAVGAAYADADLTADELKTVLRLAAPCDRLVRGPKAQGEACNEPLDCNGPAGFTCVIKGGATAGTCQQPVTVGAGLDCSALGTECTEGFYCNGQNCIVGHDVGVACVRTDECGTEGFCSAANVCEARRTVDADCTLDEQCLSGLCYRYASGDQVCTDRVRLARTELICEDLR
jgi:hypothetical protein